MVYTLWIAKEFISTNSESADSADSAAKVNQSLSGPKFVFTNTLVETLHLSNVTNLLYVHNIDYFL